MYLYVTWNCEQGNKRTYESCITTTKHHNWFIFSLLLFYEDFYNRTYDIMHHLSILKQCRNTLCPFVGDLPFWTFTCPPSFVQSILYPWLNDRTCSGNTFYNRNNILDYFFSSFTFITYELFSNNTITFCIWNFINLRKLTKYKILPENSIFQHAERTQFAIFESTMKWLCTVSHFHIF